MGATWTKSDFLKHKKSLNLIHLDVMLQEVVKKSQQTYDVLSRKMATRSTTYFENFTLKVLSTTKHKLDTGAPLNILVHPSFGEHYQWTTVINEYFDSERPKKFNVRYVSVLDTSLDPRTTEANAAAVNAWEGRNIGNNIYLDHVDSYTLFNRGLVLSYFDGKAYQSKTDERSTRALVILGTHVTGRPTLGQ